MVSVLHMSSVKCLQSLHYIHVLKILEVLVCIGMVWMREVEVKQTP